MESEKTTVTSMRPYPDIFSEDFKITDEINMVRFMKRIISHKKSDLLRILQLSSINQGSEDSKTSAPQVWSVSVS
jgi:hypothetical protein